MKQMTVEHDRIPGSQCHRDRIGLTPHFHTQVRPRRLGLCREPVGHVDLPGPIESRYTEEQIDFIENLNEAWQNRLKGVERKVARQQPLNEDEKRLALLLTTEALVAEKPEEKKTPGMPPSMPDMDM